MKLVFNLDDLTIGDLADIEDVSGVAVTGINLQQPPLKLIPALIWVTQRREDPAFSYQDARAVKLADLEIVGEAPTLAVEAGAATAASLNGNAS